jgi:hypothetical protein
VLAVYLKEIRTIGFCGGGEGGGGHGNRKGGGGNGPIVFFYFMTPVSLVKVSVRVRGSKRPL